MDYCFNHLIWQYLPTIDILNLGQSCRQYNYIVNDSYNWRFLLRRDFNMYYRKDNCYEEYCRQIIYKLSNLYTEIANMFSELDIVEDNGDESIRCALIYYKCSLLLLGKITSGYDINIKGTFMNTYIPVPSHYYCRDNYKPLTIIEMLTLISKVEKEHDRINKQF